MTTYTLNVPDPPHLPSDDVQDMQNNTNAISQWTAADHVIIGGGGTFGQHTQVRFPVETPQPTAQVDPASVLYTSPVDGHPQLFFKNSLFSAGALGSQISASGLQFTSTMSATGGGATFAPSANFTLNYFITGGVTFYWATTPNFFPTGGTGFLQFTIPNPITFGGISSFPGVQGIGNAYVPYILSAGTTLVTDIPMPIVSIIPFSYTFIGYYL